MQWKAVQTSLESWTCLQIDLQWKCACLCASFCVCACLCACSFWSGTIWISLRVTCPRSLSIAVSSSLLRLFSWTEFKSSSQSKDIWTFNCVCNGGMYLLVMIVKFEWTLRTQTLKTMWRYINIYSKWNSECNINSVLMSFGEKIYNSLQWGFIIFKFSQFLNC